MALKPEYSVMSGLTVGAVVFAIHAQATPTQSDIQALPSGNQDVDSAERKATVMSAGVVAGISLLAKDPTIFIIGSAATLAMALWTRHSNWSVDGKYLSHADQSMAGSANSTPEAEVAQTVPYTMFSGGGSGSSDFVGS
jgi:hypothetical protein